MGKNQKNARLVAFEILLKTEKEKSFSNIVVDTALKDSSLEARDKAFVSRLVYGCIERKITLDFQIESHLSGSIKTIKTPVLIVLRMGAYQILFMDKVPDFSAVNECVKLSHNIGVNYASGLINAVLRKISSYGIIFPDENDSRHLSVRYSCPLNLISMWKKAYGEENTKKLLEASLETPETVIRVNTLLTTPEKLIHILFDEGIIAEKTYIENALVINKTGAEIDLLPSFKKGLFHVQDIASQLCVKALGVKENEMIIDACSAPGGKAFTIAEEMKNTGRIFAFDLYPSRTELIDKGAERLKIENIETCVCDSTKYYPSVQKADRVLCDVVCSGLGVIRRKPEIKYKELDSFKELPEIQYTILKNASCYVKTGGRLVYSTCTLNKRENERVCDRFLEENSSFRCIQPLDIPHFGDMYYTLMPHINGSDGFFIAVFERIGD